MNAIRNRTGRLLLVLFVAYAITLAEARAQYIGPTSTGDMYSNGYGYPRMHVRPYSYGTSYGSYGNYGQYQMPTYTQEGSGNQQSSHNSIGLILTAVGLPNDDGKLRWPWALSVLASVEEGDRLRRKAEALCQVAALQAQNGQVNPRLGQEMSQTVEELRRHLRHAEEKVILSRAAYEEADRFLDRLNKTPEVIGDNITGVGNGSSQLRATGGTASSQQGSIAQVGVYDKYYEPQTISVAVGTTVQWTNQGSHPHTVTSDNGTWDSGKMMPGTGYKQTFTRPGTYPYHCSLHPQQMRGVVIVK